MRAYNALTIGVRVPSRTSGGGRVFVERLVEALLNHPAQPRVIQFVIGDEPPPSLHERLRTISVVPSTSPMRERLVAPRSLRAAVSRHPIDVLLCPGTAAVNLPRTPVVLWPLTVAPFEHGTRRLLGSSLNARLRIEALRALIVRACNHADAAIFSSNYARDLHRSHARGLQHVPTTVIRPATSLPHPRGDGSVVRGGRPDGPLLFVSHLYPYKMVDEMIESSALARRATSLRSPLLIAGSPVDRAYMTRLENTVSRLGLTEEVTFLGNVSPGALPDLYRSARAFVFPSISENAGSYALIDAFCHDVPVLSSAASSMPEIVGAAGLYFDPRIPDTLAACLEHIVTSRDLEDALSARSAARSATFPTWENIAAELHQFASTVVDSHHAHQSPRRTHR